MSAHLERTTTPPSRWISVAIWAVAGALLLLPLAAMQFTQDVSWTASDFAVFGTMLLIACGGYELIARTGQSLAYRAGAGLMLAGAFLLVWITLAVGIIGSEQNDANLIFLAVLATGGGGAALARLGASGMARTLLAMVAAQWLVAVIALFGDMGRDGPLWPRDVLVLTALFTGIWLAASWLFRRASAAPAK